VFIYLMMEFGGGFRIHPPFARFWALALPCFVFCLLCETRRMREAGSLCENAAWTTLEADGPGEVPMIRKKRVVGSCKVHF
jgi:hypothetical protein